MTFVVREVVFERRCHPRREAFGEPNMVCPLCALHKRLFKKTAIPTNECIQCFSCERLSAIFSEDGSIRLLPQSTEAVFSGIDIEPVKAALLHVSDASRLGALLSFDGARARPQVIGYALPRIRLDQSLAAIAQLRSAVPN